MKNKIRTIILIGITVIIFYILFRKISFISVIDVLLKAKWHFLLGIVLFEVLITLLKSRRWQIILESIGYNLPFKNCLYLTLAAFPFLTIMPSQSGDIVKSIFLKDKIPVSKTVGTILTEKFFDLLILIMFTFIGLLFFPRKGILIIIVAMSTTLLFIFFIPHRTIIRKKLLGRLIGKKILSKISNLFLSLKVLLDKKNFLLKIINYSLVSWLMNLIEISFLFYALNIKIPFIFVLGNIPIAIFVSFIPVTLGGMGIRDAAIIYLFSDYASNAQLMGVGLLFSFFRYWLISIAGLFFLKKVDY